MRVFVVTGCGRSGTAYVSRVLTAAGHPCGHEQVFTAHTTSPPVSFGGFQGDASWLAAPFLEGLPSGSLVLHQVRRPTDVVRSFLGIGFFSLRPEPLAARGQGVVERARRVLTRRSRRTIRSDFLSFIATHAPAVLAPPDELSRCVEYWIRWNEAVERHANRPGIEYVRYRLEDLDADLLARILGALGDRDVRNRAVSALRQVPTDVNSRVRASDVSWATILQAKGGHTIARIAERYGYEPEGA